MKRPTMMCGFTLIELTLILAIVAISLNILLPASNKLIQANLTQVAKQEAIDMMSFARASAINYRMPVTLCSLNADQTCQIPWGKNLSVFTDFNGDGVLNDNDQLLRQQAFKPFDWLHKYRPANRAMFQWNSVGVSNGTAGSIEFCHPSHASSKFALIVSFSGRIRASRDYDGDGVPERIPGTPIGC